MLAYVRRLRDLYRRFEGWVDGSGEADSGLDATTLPHVWARDPELQWLYTFVDQLRARYLYAEASPGAADEARRLRAEFDELHSALHTRGMTWTAYEMARIWEHGSRAPAVEQDSAKSRNVGAHVDVVMMRRRYLAAGGGPEAGRVWREFENHCQRLEAAGHAETAREFRKTWDERCTVFALTY